MSDMDAQAYRTRFPSPGTSRNPLSTGKVTSNTDLYYRCDTPGLTQLPCGHT